MSPNFSLVAANIRSPTDAMKVTSDKLDGENGGMVFERFRDRLFESGRGTQIDFAANADHRGAFSMRNGGGDRVRSCHRPSFV